MNPTADLGMLAAITTFLAVAAALLRKYRSRIASFVGQREMKVVARLALTSQHSLHLVQVREALLLISTSPGECAVLRQMTLKEEEANCLPST